MEGNSVFVLAPYLAFGILGAGLILRLLLTPRQPSALQAELAEAKNAFAGRIWWIGLFTLLAGHFIGLLFPRAVMSWNANQPRLYLLEAVAGIAGLAFVISSVVLIARHFRKPTISVLTELFEAAFLAFLFVCAVSGLLIAVLHRWGSSWGVTILTPYAMSILRGQPAPVLVAQMPFLVRLHVLSTFAAIALVPLTRLAALPVVAIHRCVALAGVPVRAAGNAVSAWLVRHNPSAWFWPEED